MAHQRQVAHALASAVLAGPPTADGFSARMANALGSKARWVRSLSRKVFERFGSALTQRHRARLIRFIAADAGFRDAWWSSARPQIRRYLIDYASMEPRPGALAQCALPELATAGDLAAWLGVSTTKLDWYADLRGMNDRGDSPLAHYRYRWIRKKHSRFRLMEIPKVDLREIQRKILREILDRVPAHNAAHGFRRQRSCLTCALPHAGKETVLRMDLRNFFVSIPARRINALFKTLGYPDAVATLLTSLCTHRVPVRILREIPYAEFDASLPWAERKQYRDSHLPQGAPTSPALANLCALHLDLRLAALADTVQGAYTRYADDLIFSGDETVRRRVEKLSTLVAAIALEEGFEVNYRKTRIMHDSDR